MKVRRAAEESKGRAKTLRTQLLKNKFHEKLPALMTTSPNIKCNNHDHH